MGECKLFDQSAARAALQKTAYLPDQLPEPVKPEIVFSGKSNVGKSSMINKLLNRKKLARVSSAPGKTASINFYDCGIFTLVDLPGYGYAKVSKEEKSKWSGLVNAYFEGERPVKLVIQLVDARHAPTDDDMQMLAYLRHNHIKHIVVLTKADKLKKTEMEKRRGQVPEEIEHRACIFFSAQNGLGVVEVKSLITGSIQEASD